MDGYRLGNGIKRETYVRVTDDKMSAWLYLAEPEGEKQYTKEDIYALLHENGITYGVNHSNIIAMAKKQVCGREIKIAEGCPVREGTPAHYEFAFDEDGKEKKPVIKSDGSVDYASMSVVQQVKQGSVLAVYHSPIQGEKGCDVYGKEITVEVLRELQPLKGKGFMISPEDANVYIATVDGKIEYRDGKLDIQEVYTVNGDVSFITEKIEFSGDVIINGNVELGVSIHAGRSLTISGSVEPVQIYAGGDVILKHGIQGGGKAKIEAKGNVYADFIEHTIVEARGNVRANIIMNSQVYAEGNVIVTGKRGSIVGGYVHGQKGVEAAEIGNQVEVRTLVHAGSLPELIKRWQELGKIELVKKKELENLHKEALGLLEIKKKKKLPKMAEEQLITMQKKSKELKEQIVLLEEKMKPLILLMKEGKNASIKVNDHIYRGTIIEIDSQRQVIENSTCYMEYANVSGILTGTVIVKH